MTRNSILLISFTLILQSTARPQEFFNTTPQPIKSNFTCIGRITGYYADVPSNCRVYHNCDDQGNKFSYYCPEMTAFRQEALICDHAHLVDCQAGTRIGKRTPEILKTLNQSNNSSTKISNSGRSATTANPFFHFYSSKINSSALRSPNFSKSFQIENLNQKPGQTVNPFSKLKDQNLGNEYRQFFNQENRTRFFENTFEKPSAQMKKIFENYQVKTREEDRIRVNSDGHPVWNNNREDFRSHAEINAEKKFGNRDVQEQRDESTTTTSYFRFGHQTLETTKSYFSFKNNNYQKPEITSSSTRFPSSQLTSQRISSTTEIPFRDFTASLKPLVPNTLEYDPYYPAGGSQTTTEIYYTPSESNKLPRAFDAPNYEPPRFGVYFKIPDVWPDLNTLDDIIDRRKLFYIPRDDQKF